MTDMSLLLQIGDLFERTATRFGSRVIISHHGHEHDVVYTENVMEFLAGQRVARAAVNLATQEGQARLQKYLTQPATILLGFNAQLDQSWQAAENFVTVAARRGIPVIQWILDHPSTRFEEFKLSTSENACYLVNSDYSLRYLLQFCFPGAIAGTMGGVGSSVFSRIADLEKNAFVDRPIGCLIPLGFRRAERSVEETLAKIGDLEPAVAAAVNEAVAAARHDLEGPLEHHLLNCLDSHYLMLADSDFSFCFRLLEEAVQAFRRLAIFETARQCDVLIQSDDTAVPYIQGAAASFAAGVGMRETLLQMRECRAVLSVSPLNDLIHDRTMNAANAGCVPIIEDNTAHRAVFRHRHNALLFRYSDDSLRECLDIACNDRAQAYRIAREAFALRDDPRLRALQFHNVVAVGHRQKARLRRRGS